MSRHRHVQGIGVLSGMAALAACACGALGSDPHWAEPSRPPRDPAPASAPLPGSEPAPTPAAAAAPARRLAPSLPPLPEAQTAAPAPTSPAPVSEPPLLVAPEARVEWRFRSSTALCGAPAVSPAGLVYAASVDGYLYALASDGSYRWSHGLGGIPVGAPAVDPAGHAFVATTEPRLYAFDPDGRSSWVQSPLARLATPPVWAEPGIVYYAGRDRHLYSVAARGSAPLPHWLGASVEGALASLAGGAVGVSLGTAEAHVFRGAAVLPGAAVSRGAALVARLELAAPAEQALLGGKSHWYAVTRAGLVAFDVSSRTPAWTLPARRAGLSADERVLAVESEGDLIWLEAESGRELHRVQLPTPASAAPALANAGIALVPLVSGGLLVIDPAAMRMARIALGPAPAWPPVWSEASQRVTAAAGGDVARIDLSGWVASAETEPHSSPLGAAPVDASLPQGGT